MSHPLLPPHRPRKVRFSLPSTHNESPPGILRQPTMRVTTASSSSLQRHSSMSVSATSLHMRHARIAAREALNAIRSYLCDACNFHAEYLRRAICVLSVNSLKLLVAYVNQLNRLNIDIVKRERKLLDAVNLQCNTRHPHEQLLEEPRFSSVHQRAAFRAHHKRQRRQNSHYLLRFLTKELKLPMNILRDLAQEQRTHQEVEAFKKRLRKFHGYDLPEHSHVDSAPQSPADRPATAPRSPATDPLMYEKMHGSVPMLAELTLPSAVVQPGPIGSGITGKPIKRVPSHQRLPAQMQPTPATHTLQYMPQPQQPAQPQRPQPSYINPAVAVAGYQSAPPPPPVHNSHQPHPQFPSMHQPTHAHRQQQPVVVYPPHTTGHPVLQPMHVLQQVPQRVVHPVNARPIAQHVPVQPHIVGMVHPVHPGVQQVFPQQMYQGVAFPQQPQQPQNQRKR